MKRIEVKLALPVVAPLLDVIRELAGDLGRHLAIEGAPGDIDDELRESWTGELLANQADEVKALLSLFNDEFFSEGVVAFDEENAETIVRACAAIRLRLREKYLKRLEDEQLEAGEIEAQARHKLVTAALALCGGGAGGAVIGLIGHFFGVR